MTTRSKSKDEVKKIIKPITLASTVLINIPLFFSLLNTIKYENGQLTIN